MKTTLLWMNWVVVGLLGAVSSALAYEPSTHRELSRLAFDRSRLSDSALLTDLGFSQSGVYREVTVDGVAVGTQQPREVVAFGAAEENFSSPRNCANAAWTHPFNHFFDPQHGGRALEFGGCPYVVVNEFSVCGGLYSVPSRSMANKTSQRRRASAMRA